MSLLRETIRKHLLIEKTIGQIVSSIEVTFNLEIDRKSHSFDRSTRPYLKDYNQTPIENKEIREIIAIARKKIAENIVSEEILDGVPFIVKSVDKEIALVLIPHHQSGTYWILEVKTNFRESLDNPFRVGKNQLVIWV
jgi:hypothetical protein